MIETDILFKQSSGLSEESANPSYMTPFVDNKEGEAF